VSVLTLRAGEARIATSIRIPVFVVVTLTTTPFRRAAEPDLRLSTFQDCLAEQISDGAESESVEVFGNYCKG
jgi:hypothetical protein